MHRHLRRKKLWVTLYCLLCSNYSRSNIDGGGYRSLSQMRFFWKTNLVEEDSEEESDVDEPEVPMLCSMCTSESLRTFRLKVKRDRLESKTRMVKKLS
jgi:hypothetical protein